MSSETEESSGLIEFLTWVETHKQKLVVGGIGAMLVGGVVYVTQWKADHKEQSAGGALYEVQLKEAETDEANKPSPDEYLAVETDFAGTGAAERAVLLAARGHFVAGDYDKAKELFARFEAQYSSSPFVSTALYGVAASEDAAGNLSVAKSGYQAVVNRFANTPVAAQAKLAMASLHESADEAVEALALYDDLNRPGVPVSYSSRAIARRAKLLDAHPELEPEPETPVVPAPVETSEAAPEAPSANDEDSSPSEENSSEAGGTTEGGE